ncbi:hypothetical protein CDD81_29 [Ophiocordyceps australis]|uniref:Uncharacterized protein n=1 Tax=Ophiocordyceps australis TaxID=1399860 RepID=A0A2C5XCL0_9HYPO|nr:hypothetical protein CDD81_29 [Ophiocordyceps australis]
MMRLASRQALVTRRLSVFTARSYSSNTDPPSIPSRWLFDLQHRIRQLLSGRTETEPVRRLREKLQLLDTDWLDLVAGRDGYIPDIKWRGLDEYAVAWGDMDSMGKA